MQTYKISKINLVRDGGVVLSLTDDKGVAIDQKVLVEQSQIATCNMLGTKLASGSSVQAEASVNPTTGEESKTWLKLAL